MEMTSGDLHDWMIIDVNEVPGRPGKWWWLLLLKLAKPFQP